MDKARQKNVIKLNQAVKIELPMYVNSGGQRSLDLNEAKEEATIIAQSTTDGRDFLMEPERKNSKQTEVAARYVGTPPEHRRERIHVSSWCILSK